MLHRRKRRGMEDSSVLIDHRKKKKENTHQPPTKIQNCSWLSKIHKLNVIHQNIQSA